MPAPKQTELPIKRRGPAYKGKVRMQLQVPRKQVEIIEGLQESLGLSSNQDVIYYLLTLALSEREKILELRAARESTERIAELLEGVNMKELQEASSGLLRLAEREGSQ